jgi:benzoyl-CoA reductase/2-hydroxyglutaryl-CoA dehydratase subunit BcrC/BadD/HgdB
MPHIWSVFFTQLIKLLEAAFLRNYDEQKHERQINSVNSLREAFAKIQWIKKPKGISLFSLLLFESDTVAWAKAALMRARDAG